MSKQHQIEGKEKTYDAVVSNEKALSTSTFPSKITSETCPAIMYIIGIKYRLTTQNNQLCNFGKNQNLFNRSLSTTQILLLIKRPRKLSKHSKNH